MPYSDPQNLFLRSSHYEAAVELVKEAKSKSAPFKKFKDGIVINGEFGSDEVGKLLKQYEHKLPLIIADPPYGNIVSNDWDQGVGAESYMGWTKSCAEYLSKGASLYMWGGIGKPHDRVFFEWLSKVEEETDLTMRNLIREIAEHYKEPTPQPIDLATVWRPPLRASRASDSTGQGCVKRITRTFH